MLTYLLALTLPLLAICSIWAGHEAIFLVTVLGIIPILDFAIGRIKSIPSSNETSPSYLITFHIPHIYQTMWLVMLGVAGHQAVGATPERFILIVLCCALMAAFVTVPAHEFMHRDCEHSRLAADIAFALVGYGHYTISHPIHHVKPGVAHFGSAPALGMSVWRHFPDSWACSFGAAWRAELRRNGLNPFRNRVLRQWTLTIFAAVGFYFLWGERGLILFVSQACFAVFFVEVAGYVQHYGLRRNEGDSYTHHPAWDADFWLSNRLLINNPLHAHHHQDPMRVCMFLEPIAPTLPAGYFSLVWAALVPPIWFSIMDHRVANLLEKNRQLSCANSD